MIIDEGFGLLITLESDGTCALITERDRHFDHLHSNIYGPDSLQSVCGLTGGGSGVTVFAGECPRLGRLVLKHGGPKDLLDIFSLVTVQRELELRGMERPLASTALLSRTPRFKMIYVSPHHLRDRGIELWIKVRRSVRGKKSSVSLKELDHWEQSQHSLNNRPIFLSYHSTDKESGESICRVIEKRFEINIGKFRYTIHDGEVKIVPGHGYKFLQEFVSELMALQEQCFWKLTLGQERIGDQNSENGAFLLMNGKLQGEFLRSTMDQFIHVIHNIRRVTLENETEMITEVRRDISALQRNSITPTASQVSKVMDLFCGKAIRKNFLPKVGRFAKLMELGHRFRNHIFQFLDNCELLPTKYLGKILKEGIMMDSIFEGYPSIPSALSLMMEKSWMQILQDATLCHTSIASSAIWTCGNSDAGLHNMLISTDFLWLFDLSEPERMPIPAFLTKFLMSFFHVFGMQDDNSLKTWVVRFEPKEDGCLRLTDETAKKIPQMHTAFKYACDRCIKDIFEGDESVRTVLLNYVILQLLSDASFCLERWESKGGGEKKFYTCDRGQCLDKWLWRSLWDIYIATDVTNRYQSIVFKT
jgi:hypothetical protein